MNYVVKVIKQYFNNEVKAESLIRNVKLEDYYKNTSISIKHNKTKSGKAYKEISVDCEVLEKEDILELLDIGFVAKRLMFFEEYDDE